MTLDAAADVDTTLQLGAEIYNFGNSQPAPSLIENFPTKVTVEEGQRVAQFDFLRGARTPALGTAASRTRDAAPRRPARPRTRTPSNIRTSAPRGVRKLSPYRSRRQDSPSASLPPRTRRVDVARAPRLGDLAISAQRGPGRPRRSAETAELIVRLARENPSWGYTRLRDVMRSLGHEIGRTTVASILADHGIEPSPERRRRTSWGTFLKAHWEALAAMDFFTVEIVTIGGLVRYSVLFVMELSTRRVHIAGVTCQANEAWVRNIARHLTDGFDGFLLGKRFLILDRDPLFTRSFRQILRGSGVEPMRLPARSPNLNAYAERFVLSIKSECLDKIVPLGERHLRYAVKACVEHYHRERHHQGLGNSIIIPGDPERAGGPVRRRERLGGVLNHYYREAA